MIIPGAGNSSAWDRYAYTLNNPLRYTDPSGHCPVCIAVAVVVVVLKIVDYGWTAYDVAQAGREYFSPGASDAQKQAAAESASMAITLELLEPDDLSPIALPLDDIVRHGDDISEFIFRKSSGSADSLTPRPGVDDLENGGLSFFDSFENMNSNTPLKPGDKYVVVDPKKLYGLDTILDNTPPGHVIVRPPTLSALQEWASTWKTGIVHNFTEVVKNAIDGNPIKWK